MPLDTPLKKILIVDDEPISVAFITRLLTNRYQLFGATDGQTALELARQNRPDLILLDVMMPGRDGYAVCRALKEHPLTAGIPVIFLTALTEASAIVAGFTAGAVDYIVKPFNAVELNVRVETHLQLRANQEELTRINAELQEQQDLFLKMIPHDLRTSLAIIQGNAELLQRAVTRSVIDAVRCDALAKEILQGCTRQKALLNDLVDVGRLKAGHVTFRPVTLPVNDLITGCLSNARETLDATRYRIELPEEPLDVVADLHCIERVLTNLLATAGKYSVPDSVIVIRVWRQAPVAVVAVCAEEDDLNPQDREKLFAPYYRSYLNNTTGGIGLGLHIAKLLVEAQNGEIWTDRVDETHNRYCFTVPLKS